MKIKVEFNRWFLPLAASALLIGCGHSDNSKIEEAINAGLEKEDNCADVPVGIRVDVSKVGDDGALGILKKHGLIAVGEISLKTISGEKKATGFIFTEKGRSLVRREGRSGLFADTLACVNTGKYVVDVINAVDVGTDASGQQIAAARAKVKFIPEDWIASTKDYAQWGGFWGQVKGREDSEILFRLLKSGDAYFYRNGAVLK